MLPRKTLVFCAHDLASTRIKRCLQDLWNGEYITFIPSYLLIHLHSHKQLFSDKCHSDTESISMPKSILGHEEMPTAEEIEITAACEEFISISSDVSEPNVVVIDDRVLIKNCIQTIAG